MLDTTLIEPGSQLSFPHCSMAVITRQSTEELILALRKGEAVLEQIAHRLEEEAERRFNKAGEVRVLRGMDS